MKVNATLPPRSFRTPLSRRRKAAYAAGTLLLFLLATEGICRIVVAVGLAPDPRAETLRTVWASGGWSVDPLLGWGLLPDRVSDQGGARCEANSLGLRDEEIPVERPEGEIRLLTIGDSTVLGFGVEAGRTFSQLLEKDLRQKVRARFQVVNAGIPGYTSCQSLLYLEHRGLRLGPSVVIVETNFNDRRAVFPDGAPDSEAHFRSTYRKIRRREFLNRSTAYGLFQNLLLSAGDVLSRGYADYRRISLDAPPRVSLSAYEANMREIVLLSRNAGASVIFVGLPDWPAESRPVRTDSALVAREDWTEAERRLHADLEIYKVQAIMLQRLLNEVYDATGRSAESKPTVEVSLSGWRSTDGYTPVCLSDPYIDKLKELGRELDVPVIVPTAPPDGENIYMDYIHLNPAGHRLLADRLLETVVGLPPFESPPAVRPPGQ